VSCAGRQGTAAAYDVARFGNASKVRLGDVNAKIASEAASRVNKKRLDAAAQKIKGSAVLIA
jgi:hypothetical protein